MELLEKIKDNKAIVGVVGLGYVGLPLLMEFVEQNFKTIGFDVDKKKVELLNKGKSYIKHIDESRVKKVRDSKIFEASDDFSRIKEVDCILICVPTPLNKYREPDLSFIENTSRVLSKNIRAGQFIVLESSTYPGTTEEVMKPILEESGLKGDHDFWVAFSPEREDPNNPHFNTRTIPKVIGANTIESDDLNLSVSGSGRIKLDLEADDLTQKISGSGNIVVSGEADRAEVSISGSGNLDALDLEADHYAVRISGSGKCKINVGDSLEANISGSGSVYYKGDPDKIRSNVSGSGKVKPY